ncbi:capping protein inhibiting regulator of actin dynamics-like isoform X8 [Bolinopsis microptera]|uniref:capping protein inhibiting regulator of actin dynamics-like isoform X8 n=1 Tax=Bolinopsis microptera TaxID=2820187 RepID=UPI00307A248B
MSTRFSLAAFKAAKKKSKNRSRLGEGADADKDNEDMADAGATGSSGWKALAAANNDDFITIARHRLLRRRSIKIEVAPEQGKSILELAREKLEHVEVKTAEEIERERREKERDAEILRRKLELEELEKQRIKLEEMDRIRREEEERLRLIREEEERLRKEEEERLRLIREEEERLKREEEERIREEEERLAREQEERERIANEAAEKRAELERRRAEAEENAKRERREDYERKLAAVMNATCQKERETALKEVGKLTFLDFNSQEEWETHQREVGKLNILEIAGKFKKKGKKFRKERRKTQSINWSNAKAIINKYADVQPQEEVVRFVKPTAVDLTDLECYTGDDYPSATTPTDRSSDMGTPDSGIRSTCSQDLEQESVTQ